MYLASASGINTKTDRQRCAEDDRAVETGSVNRIRKKENFKPAEKMLDLCSLICKFIEQSFPSVYTRSGSLYALLEYDRVRICFKFL